MSNENPGRWRLDKLLSRVLPTTRNVAHKLIRSGRVTVDGVEERDSARIVDPRVQVVLVDGGGIASPDPLVLIMHKPAGVVSATEDDVEKTVLDLVPRAWQRKGLAPIGRLDKDTTGLLLLSDDGQLAHALTHPRRHVEKVYAMSYDGTLAPDAAARAAAGITLADGTTCLPATLVIEDAARATMTLREGKYHQVKRMMAALGGVVTGLHRVRFGPLELPVDLAPGDVRELTAEERRSLTATHS